MSKKFLQGYSAAFLLIMTMGFVSSCGKDSALLNSKNEAADKIMDTVTAEEIKNFRLHQTREGRVAWTLTADKARFINQGEVFLEKPILKLHPTITGKGYTLITSDKGKVELKTSQIETYGNTILESPDKKIYTSDIRYDPSEDKIFSDKKVLIITEDSEIEGSSMVADSRLERITITNQQVKVREK